LPSNQTPQLPCAAFDELNLCWLEHGWLDVERLVAIASRIDAHRRAGRRSRDSLAGGLRTFLELTIDPRAQRVHGYPDGRANSDRWQLAACDQFVQLAAADAYRFGCFGGT
jgi:hypothetical protein